MKSIDTLETVVRPVADYQALTPTELFERTAAARRALGDRVMVLDQTLFPHRFGVMALGPDLARLQAFQQELSWGET